jgi:hypothetical protein
MTEADWLTCSHPESMLNFLSRESMARRRTSDRKLRLFAVACCRRIWQLIAGAHSQRAVTVGERLADGQAEEWELEDAYDMARLIWNNQEFDGNDEAYEAAFWAAEPVATGAALHGAGMAARAIGVDGASIKTEEAAQAALIREIFGNPFRSRPRVKTAWRTDTVTVLARQMYESRDFSAMPILADALQDAGCANDDILNHCRGLGPHVRGCWVVDLVLGKA